MFAKFCFKEEKILTKTLTSDTVDFYLYLYKSFDSRQLALPGVMINATAETILFLCHVTPTGVGK